MLRPEDPRSRSRSPVRSSSHRHSHSDRRRSGSPQEHHRHRHHHAHHKRKRTPVPDTETYIPATVVPPRPVVLPFNARPLSKHDLATYTPMFASYLDIQKGKVLEEMSGPEVKGRWKSFVGRWNRKELADGWYDPLALQKATATAKALEEDYAIATTVPPQATSQYKPGPDSEDDDVGPAPPPVSAPGPARPTRSDITLRDEAIAEAHADARNSMKQARKDERRIQKERMEELVPRAEPGTRERQMEKKREAVASNRAFGDAKGGGDGVQDMPEGELIGGDAGVKEMKAREERKKNDREIKREEVLRARAQEREERLVGMREREDKTMAMLRGLAKERFG